MGTRRRHGANFTDSLSSFRQTMHSDANSTCSTYKSFSQDSLDITSNNNRCSALESFILSGNFVPKVEDVSVLRDASDVCQNIDRQCYQISEPIVELSTSVSLPLKEDCNMLNTAICISLEQNSESNEKPQIMDKENFDNNQVKDPGKPDILLEPSVVVKPTPTRSTLSQMHILKKKSDTGHQNNLPGAVTDSNTNNVHSNMNHDIQQPMGDTNGDHKFNDACFNSIEVCHGIDPGKSIGSNCVQYELYSSMSGEEENDSHTNRTNDDLNELHQYSFAEVLSYLMKDFHPTEPIECPKQILKRLSANFTASPKTFTERLITIIEESVTHNDSSTGNNSAVSLSRLTKEFRSMCKFVEDESVPEWPPSPIANCSSNFEGATNSSDTSWKDKENCDKTVGHLKTPTAQLSSPISAYFTPESCMPTKSLKTPLNIQKSGNNSISCISCNAQNDTFETLEAQCKIMCSNEDQNNQPTTFPMPQHISANNSANMDMKKVLLLCEQQMASLDLSDCDSTRMQSRIGIQSSPNSMSHRSSPKKMQSLQQQLRKKQLERWNSDNKNKFSPVPMDISKSPLTAGNTTSSTQLQLSQKNDKIDTICKKSPSLHELEESVLLGIAEKRRRCFDTAMAMMRLNSNSETGQAEQATETLSEINAYCKSKSLENSSKEFFNTLISCNNYYNYLEKHKTFINQVCSKEYSILKNDSDKNYLETNKPKSPNNDRLNTEFFNDKEDNQIEVSTPKLSSTPINSPLKHDLPKSQKRSSRPRLFTTPGKSPVARYHKRKPVLFPNLCKTSAFKKTSTSLKSPATKELHNFNDKTVASPVGKYIKGTSAPFESKIPNKIHNMLHTPEHTVHVTPQKDTKQQCHSRGFSHTGRASAKLKVTPRTPVKSSPHIQCQSSDGRRDVERVGKSPAGSFLKQTSPQSNQKRCNRPKLFTTPGKTPVSKYQKRKPLLFSNVSKNVSPGMSPCNTLKSPDMRGRYRFNDATVISPVGMYIKGTDIQFIQNVQSKTNDMLLTPEKSKSISSQANSRQQCPSKIFTSTEEASLKFRLSPRSPIKSSHGNYENHDMNMPLHKSNQNSDNRLALPKVVYTIPSQIRTETRQGIGMNRVKGLLATTQNKVIIRHEGRVGSVERKKNTESKNEEQEIIYGSTDESIQVEKIATKTNFISKQKV